MKSDIKKNWLLLMSVFFMTVLFLILTVHTDAKSHITYRKKKETVSVNYVPSKPTYKKGTFSEGVSKSLIPYKIYTSKKKTKKVVFVFGGYGGIKNACGGMSLYYEIRDKRFLPGYHVVFVQKEEGSWEQYSKEAIGSMIEEVKGDLRAKEVYFVGFSQGVYDSKYIMTSKAKKWNGALLVDGAANMSFVKRHSNYSIMVAGYDKGSYGQGKYFNEYYEPLNKDLAHQDRDYHDRIFNWAVLNDETFGPYNEDGLFKVAPINAIGRLVYR